MASRKVKNGSFGACSFKTMSPPQLAADTKTVNLAISFEDALKLNLAIDEGVRNLNRYNRATKEGSS